jgi:hypothetical protein
VSRQLQLVLDVAVEDDADEIAVAEAVHAYLCRAEDDDVPGVFSFDGCEPTS